jgi:hypothetical protein
MIAQFFECTMLFDFLEKFKEDMNVGYLFADNDVIFGVSKESHKGFFVYLSL